MMALSKIPAAWRQTLPLLLLALLAVMLAYRDTGTAMVEIWNRSETFAHAFVVPPIALWLIWRQRAVLAVQAPKPAPLFLLPLAGFALLWLLGDLVAANSVTQLAFMGMLVSAVPATLGWATTRCIAFPLGFMFFAVPIGEFMTPMLMEWTADFTVSALRLSGLPVYREGQQFIIPSGSWSVVEACSGIRYLMASVMVGTLFAYLNFNSMRKRWIFVGVAILLPVFANWLRAYMIVMLGHYSDNKLAVGADHLVYGWVFFGIIMLAMFMIGARWSDPEPAAANSTVVAATPAAAGLTRIWPTALFLMAVLAAPLALLKVLDMQGGTGAVSLLAPELSAGGWQTSADAAANWKSSYENPVAELQASYRKPSADATAAPPVDLQIAYYRRQNYQSKLITSTNELVHTTDKHWTVISTGSTAQALPGGPVPVRTAELRGGGLSSSGESSASAQRLAVRYVYWINGALTTSDLKAKAYGAVYRLLGRGDDAAVVFVSTGRTEGVAAKSSPDTQADALLAGFLHDNWQQLDALLRAARDSAHKSKPNEAVAR